MDKPREADGATIAALATPPGAAGLAVVRVSGPAALRVAAAVCDADASRLAPASSHRAVLTVVRAPDGRDALDQVLLLPMHAPHSYTGEDVVEFFCHGGSVPAALVLEACLAAGARQAGPGEFTRRAFLHGRLSLDQAEAVADLIHAEDRLAARAALARLRGGLRAEVAAVEAPLLELLAALEGSLEFSEHEDVDVPRSRVVSVLDGALRALDALLADAEAGRRVRDGVRTVLAGPVNAGKSTLFNTLLGRERALVDADAGTTRDVVSARVELDGVTFHLQDTAGLRDAAGRVEAAGIARTHEALAAADLVLWLRPLDDPAVPEPPRTEATVLAVAARADLAPRSVTPAGALRVSARTGEGIEELKAAMVAAVQAERMHEVARTGRALARRHRERLELARSALAEVRTVVADGAPDEVTASLLAPALQGLGEVTGRVYSERLLGEVFSKFCVGK
ncbi:MAG TPA: tRNA uridine-5-carboxymethylaminomethyl(34) synthesis GTPase MnmE [Candidatus Krumholzibacteria bacterium]|nr:tRNA uridine-5-carboxymethylaminomethyl(34) synthesis GTPase MnmE [Candidatus Krumholzibacteria bacterium]